MMMKIGKPKLLHQTARGKEVLTGLTIWCFLVTVSIMSIQPTQALSKDPAGQAGPAAGKGQCLLSPIGLVARSPKGLNGHAGQTHRVRGLTAQSGPPGSSDPVPIPGGDFIPGFGTIHNFLSGPSNLTFEGAPLEGVDVEPNGISNFRGFIAQAYLEADSGALGNDGVSYDFASDIRVLQGEYVSVDGTHHRGTFVLI